MNRIFPPQLNFTDSGALTQTINFTNDDMTNTTWDLPDPLIDWLPYKIEKYIPSGLALENSPASTTYFMSPRFSKPT